MISSFKSRAKCNNGTDSCCEKQTVKAKDCVGDCVKKCLCFILCLGCLSSQAHMISGKIFALKTNKPINNVFVFIEKSDVGTVTTQEGFFTLSVNNVKEKKVSLNINMIGYKNLIIPIDFTEYEVDLDSIMLMPESIE